MSKIESAKDQFYDILKEKIREGLIENEDIDLPDSGFYELCKTYADIGLNALKKPSDNGLGVQGVFQFVDMDKAVDATNCFIKEHTISNVDALFEAIEIMHGHAVEWDDKRSHDAILWGNANYNRNTPRLGNWTIFSELPDNIFEEIVDAVKSGRKKWN